MGDAIRILAAGLLLTVYCLVVPNLADGVARAPAVRAEAAPEEALTAYAERLAARAVRGS